MASANELGTELAEFRKRVDELLAVRTQPAGARPSTLDAALVELQYAADVLWPGYEDLAATTQRQGGQDTREQQLLRALFQRLPQPVVLLDREGVVRRLNFAAGRLFGMRPGYATGRSLTGALTHEARAPFRSQVAAVARGEGDRSLSVGVLGTPGGAPPGSAGSSTMRATLTALRPPGATSTAVMAVFVARADEAPSPQDAASGQPSGSRPPLAEVTRHAELLDLLDDMATTLLRAPAASPGTMLERAAERLRGSFADWVLADLLTPGGRRLRRVAVLGPQDAGEEPAGAIAAQDPYAAPVIAEAAGAGVSALQVRPEDADVLGEVADGTPVLGLLEGSSLVCVPLRLPSGTVRGVLTLVRCGGRRAFELAEAGALDRISRHIALALHTS